MYTSLCSWGRDSRGRCISCVQFRLINEFMVEVPNYWLRYSHRCVGVGVVGWVCVCMEHGWCLFWLVGRLHVARPVNFITACLSTYAALWRSWCLSPSPCSASPHPPLPPPSHPWSHQFISSHSSTLKLSGSESGWYVVFTAVGS